VTDANGRCRACLEPVIYARTELRSRWFPLNPEPDPAGNQAAWQDSDGIWKTRQLTEKSDPKWGFETVFMPHVATCEREKERRARAKEAKRPVPANVVPHSTFLARLRAKRGHR
jgi:hypothetical protein